LVLIKRDEPGPRRIRESRNTHNGGWLKLQNRKTERERKGQGVRKSDERREGSIKKMKNYMPQIQMARGGSIQACCHR